MVMPGDDDMMAKLDMVKSYPHLLQALDGEDGFDPLNPSVQKSMRSLMRELNGLLSTTYELNTTDIPNNEISYMQVSQTKSDHSFLNSKEWVDTAIQISGSKHGGTCESTYRITDHIMKFYHNSFLAGCKSQQFLSVNQ